MISFMFNVTATSVPDVFIKKEVSETIFFLLVLDKGEQLEL